MFNTLTTEEKQQVKSIVDMIDVADIKVLHQYTVKMLPDVSYLTHIEFVHDLVAIVLDDQNTTAQEFIEEDLIPTLVQVMTQFCSWCSKYITKGDRIPNDLIGDIFTIARTAYHDYWHVPINNNLSCIPALVQATQGGKDVSTALFTAIISTAFDYDMEVFS